MRANNESEKIPNLYKKHLTKRYCGDIISKDNKEELSCSHLTVFVYAA